ncbi:MAG: oxidoreductase [Lutibacter sp.]|nr:aldo/keto reductase [bacterium AH-315-A23]PHQ56524.1 MAG: oxidoreductase [Lutibacter sp.]
MNKIKLTDKLEISRIVHGHWRLTDWNLNAEELLKLTQQTIELGISTFDHADIYGNYSCEKLFGDALNLNKGLRKDIQIITKCGIKLISDKFPSRKIKLYDYSFDHIISSVENSLINFRTDYIDVLLLHRPSPFINPEEVSKAFSILKQQGKVLNFGVSNFNPQQFNMLTSYLEEPLITNQVEMSPYCLEHFENGNIDYFLTEKIKPMAWSPLAGGNIINPTTEKGQRLLNTLSEVANDLSINNIDTLIYSWLLNHPAQIIPVIGTRKIERIKNAINALKIKLSSDLWQKIYIASLGKDLP